MTIAAKVKRYLDKQGIVYQIINHARTETLEETALSLGIERNQIARAVLAKDPHGLIMVVLPATHRLDFTGLKKFLRRDLVVVTGREADKIFSDCEPGSRPPLGPAYGLSCVFDSSLRDKSDVYFEPGTHNALIHIAQAQFQDLATTAGIANIAIKADSRRVAIQGKGSMIETTLGNELLDLEEKISWSNVVGQLEYLKQDVILQGLIDCINANYAIPSSELVKKIEDDKTLTDILTIFHKYILAEEGSTDRVLENLFKSDKKEFLIALASGFSILSSLQVKSIKGPFSARQIFRHGLYAATLTYWITEQKQLNINPFDCFFSALIQNVGVLLLGCMFPPEYQLLNRLATANPGSSNAVLEKRLLGMGQAHEIVSAGHERLGAWLLRQWGFNLNIITHLSEHHNPLIVCEENMSINILQIANSILSNLGFREDNAIEQCPSLLNLTQLTEYELYELEDRLESMAPALERIANYL